VSAVSIPIAPLLVQELGGASPLSPSWEPKNIIIIDDVVRVSMKAVAD